MERKSGNQPDPWSGTIETGRELPGVTSAEASPIAHGLTWRAALIGLALSALLAFLEASAQAVGGRGLSGLTSNGLGSGALFLLFVLILGIGLLKRVGIIRSGLEPRELLIIFSMLTLASAVLITLFYLIPHMAGFSFYATRENQWESLVLPVLPDGLVIKDHAVAKGFFEGLSSGGGVPYGVWIWPLAAWAILLGALYFVMISLMVILRKPWIDHERLSFPLAQLPLTLTGGEPGVRPLLGNGIFWSGFTLPAFVGFTAILKMLLPVIPAINLSFYTRFYRNSIGVPIYTNFLVLGISYLVSLEILASILLFTLISYVQIYLIIVSGSAILGSPPNRPSVHYTHLHQEVIGALAVLVCVGLYEARHHLRDVFGKAFGYAPGVDDRDELLSYRTAVFGSVGGVVFICCWLWMTGISSWILPIFVAVMLVTFVGVTRVLAETGVVLGAPMSSMQIFLHSAGTRILGPSTTAGFFLAQPWAFPARTHVMAGASTALKLTHGTRQRSRSLFYVLLLTLLVGGVTTTATMLHHAYSLGAYGFSMQQYVTELLNRHLNYYGSAISDSSDGQPIRLLWSGVGAVAMSVLIFARKRFYWWPIHPIGYAAGTIHTAFWINIFVGWLVKLNVLKYGGPSLYGYIRPFFLGMILGQAVISSIRELLHFL